MTVNALATYRKGEYFRKELAADNSSAPVWQAITNIAVVPNGPNADLVSTNTGNLLLAKATEAFIHDADGNLISDSLWTNRWDGENRRTTVESRAGILPAINCLKEDWAYLPDGRWIQRIVSTNNGSSWITSSTNRYVWDGQALLAVLDHTNGVVTSFLRGIDLSGSPQGAGGVGGVLILTQRSTSQPSSAFYCFDGNGKVSALINATYGAEVARYDYDPFGQTIRADGTLAKINPVRFSTQYADDTTGELKYLYRDYRADTGRWLSRDPIAERGGLNLYGFVHNNPQSYVDRDGHFFDPVGGLISIGMGWGIAVLTGEDYSPGEAVLDFTTGSLGPGLLKRGYDLYKTCGKVRVQAKLTATAVKRLRSVVDAADAANTRDFVDKAIRAEWSLRVSTENKVWEMAGIAAWQGVKAIAKSEIKNHTDTVDRLNVTIDQTIHPDGRTDTKIDIQTNHQDFPPDFSWPPIETPGPFPPIELPRD